MMHRQSHRTWLALVAVLGVGCVTEAGGGEGSIANDEAPLWASNTPIRSALADRCLQASGTIGTQLVNGTCGGAYQSFRVLPNGEIRTADGKCVDLQGNVTTSGTPIQVYTCNGTAAQKWSLDADGTVRHRQSGKCMDVAGGSSVSGTPVRLWDCNRTAAQIWQYAQNEQIRVSGASLCVDVSGAAIADGTAIQLWSCNGTSAQRWVFEPSGRIRGPGYKCIGTTGTGNGSLVQLQTCGATANQTWSVDVASNRIVGPGGRCLRPINGTVSNGTDLELRDCGATAQTFVSERASQTSSTATSWIARKGGAVSWGASSAYFLTTASEFCSAPGDATITKVDLATGASTPLFQSCGSPTQGVEGRGAGQGNLYYVDWGTDSVHGVGTYNGGDSTFASASGSVNHRGLELDDTWFYWADDVGLRRHREDGGGANETLVPIASAPYVALVASDSTDLFYTTLASSTYSLWRVGKSGGAPTFLRTFAFDQKPVKVVARNGYLYWGDRTTGDVVRMPTSGGATSLFADAPGPDLVTDLTFSDNYVYWVGRAPDPSNHVDLPTVVWRAPIAGGAASVALAGLTNVRALHFSSGRLYWVDDVGLRSVAAL